MDGHGLHLHVVDGGGINDDVFLASIIANQMKSIIKQIPSVIVAFGPTPVLAPGPHVSGSKVSHPFSARAIHRNALSLSLIHI